MSHSAAVLARLAFKDMYRGYMASVDVVKLSGTDAYKFSLTDLSNRSWYHFYAIEDGMDIEQIHNRFMILLEDAKRCFKNSPE